MRGPILGILLAAGVAGAAGASDYIVVKSTDPAVKPGQALDAGARVTVAAGKTLTVMRLTGEVTTLQAGPAGVTLPAAHLAANYSTRFDSLKVLIDPPPQSRAFGASRGVTHCPPAASFDDILRLADLPGCKGEAREAFDVYIAAASR